MDDLACRELVELVTDYLEDVLGPDETERIMRHLAGCDGCTAYVEQVAATVRASAAQRRREVPGEAVQADLLAIHRAWLAERDRG